MKAACYIAIVASTAMSFVAAAPAPTAAQASVPEYFLIRHAEKNADGSISARGMQREQCLVKLFSKDSKYNIAHIMTQHPYPDDPRSQRPYNTTLPLADSLGITIDHPCNFTDTSCVGEAALAYSGPGNVLIAWGHLYLPQVSTAIDGENVPAIPDDHFDWIFNQPAPYTEVTLTSEDCAGLDD